MAERCAQPHQEVGGAVAARQPEGGQPVREPNPHDRAGHAEAEIQFGKSRFDGKSHQAAGLAGLGCGTERRRRYAVCVT